MGLLSRYSAIRKMFAQLACWPRYVAVKNFAIDSQGEAECTIARARGPACASSRACENLESPADISPGAGRWERAEAPKISTMYEEIIYTPLVDSEHPRLEAHAQADRALLTDASLPPPPRPAGVASQSKAPQAAKQP